MIGLSELLIPAIIVLLILVFGAKAFTDAYRKWKGVKKEMKEIDKEFSKEIKNI